MSWIHCPKCDESLWYERDVSLYCPRCLFHFDTRTMLEWRNPDVVGELIRHANDIAQYSPTVMHTFPRRYSCAYCDVVSETFGALENEKIHDESCPWRLLVETLEHLEDSEYEDNL